MKKYFINKKDEKHFNERLITHAKIAQKRRRDTKKEFAKMMGITVKELNKVLTIWSQK